MLWLMPADLRRARIGMIFIGIDASSGAAPSVAGAATIRAACRRLVHGRQTSGGKGANPFSGPYGGTQVFLDDGPRESANPLAENAEIPGTHHGMSGGKGGKGGNLKSAGKTGPADDAAKRRKPAETGGNPFWAAYSGGKVFLEGLRETARALAEIAENAEITKAAVGAATPTTSKSAIANCANCANLFSQLRLVELRASPS